MEYDLTKQPSKEEELTKITGSRMVPAFVFKHQSWLGFTRKSKIVIGFEQNIDEIKRLLNIDK